MLIFVNIIKYRIMEELIEDYTYIKFLDAAERDLAAVESLYEENHHSQAVYFLQQSIEKSCKFIGLTFRFIQYDELKRLGHNPHMVFKKSFNSDIMKTVGGNSVFDQLEHTMKVLDTMDKRVKAIIYHLNVALNEEHIHLKENQLPSDTVIEYFSNNQFAQIYDLPLIPLLKERRGIKEVEQMCLNLIDKINDDGICQSCQIILSFLVSGVEENSRYPNYDTGTDPSGIYADNSPFVKELPFFISIQKKCIEILRKYHSQLN